MTTEPITIDAPVLPGSELYWFIEGFLPTANIRKAVGGYLDAMDAGDADSLATARQGLADVFAEKNGAWQNDPRSRA